MKCKRGYADLIKPLELEYFTCWNKTIFDFFDKISVLASWEPAFSLKTNSWIEGYQVFFITVSATCLYHNFGKHSWKDSLTVQFRLAAYAFIRNDFMD